jgi:hypothetical protein
MEAVLIAITPLVIAGLKQLLIRLEKDVPVALLPALGPIVAIVASTLMSYLGWADIAPATAGMLGMAGVGAREITVKTARIVTG